MKRAFRSILTTFGLTALLAGVACVPAWGQNAAVTTQELAQRAEIVAVGKVTSLSSEWNEAKTGIRTRVTLRVDEYIKGSEPVQTITVFVPGGEVGVVGEVYSHTAKFKKDENVVVFAERDRHNRYRVTAGSEGKLSIVQDQATGRMMVGQNKTLEQLTQQVRSAIQTQNEN